MKLLTVLATMTLTPIAHAEPSIYGLQCIRNAVPADQLLMEGSKDGSDHVHLSFVPDVFNRASLRSIGVSVLENDRVEIDLEVKAQSPYKNPDDDSRNIDLVFPEASELTIFNVNAQRAFDVSLFLGIAKSYPTSTGQQEFFIEFVTNMNSAQTVLLQFDPSECTAF